MSKTYFKNITCFLSVVLFMSGKVLAAEPPQNIQLDPIGCPGLSVGSNLGISMTQPLRASLERAKSQFELLISGRRYISKATQRGLSRLYVGEPTLPIDFDLHPDWKALICQVKIELDGALKNANSDYSFTWMDGTKITLGPEIAFHFHQAGFLKINRELHGQPLLICGFSIKQTIKKGKGGRKKKVYSIVSEKCYVKDDATSILESMTNPQPSSQEQKISPEEKNALRKAQRTDSTDVERLIAEMKRARLHFPRKKM